MFGPKRNQEPRFLCVRSALMFLLLACWFMPQMGRAHAQGVIIFPNLTNNLPQITNGLPVIIGSCVPPANDAFTNATLLAGEFMTVTNNLRCATAEPNEPTHAGASAQSSVWYRWTAPADANVLLQFLPTFEYIGTNFTLTLAVPTRIAVYHGASLENLIVVPLQNSRFEAIRDEEYFIAVDGGQNAFTLQLAADTLRVNPLTHPIAGEAGLFEIAPIDPADDFAQVTINIGDHAETNSVPPFAFSATSPTNGNMAITASALTTDGRVLHLYYGALPFRPQNDDFSHAIELPDLMLGQVQQYSTVNFTREDAEPAHFGATPPAASIWWKWTPTHSALTTLHFRSGGFAIYKGSSLSDLQLIANVGSIAAGYSTGGTLIIRAWNEPGSGDNATDWYTANARFSFTNEVGVTYWIAEVSPSYGDAWTLRQHFQWPELTTYHVGEATEFLLKGDATVPWPAAIQINVERRYISFIDPFPGPGWLAIATNTIGAPGSVLIAPPLDSPGHYRAIISAQYDDGGSWREVLEFDVHPANDDYSSATELPADLEPKSFPGDGSFASAEPGEPLRGTNIPMASVWWRWTPAQNMAVRFRTSYPHIVGGSSLPLDIFTGASISNLIRVSHNDSRTFSASFVGYVPLNAVAGQTYFLRVSSSTFDHTLAPSFNLVVEPLDAPLAGLFILSTAIGVPQIDGSIAWNPFAKVFTPDRQLATNRIYRAQYYYGPSIDKLAPFFGTVFINDGVSFGSVPELAGTVSAGVCFPNGLLAGENYFFDLRAWDSSAGQTYEQARANGGLTGHSKIVQLIAGSELTGPTFPTNIGDVRLLLPPSAFNPGKLSFDNPSQLRLTGSQGIYVIESTDLANGWVPASIVTNAADAISFPTPASTNTLKIYRSRLIN